MDISEEEKLLKELMEKYPIDKMVKFSEIDIQDKLKENAFQQVKFYDLWITEKIKMEKVEELMEKLVGELPISGQVELGKLQKSRVKFVDGKKQKEICI